MIDNDFLIQKITKLLKDRQNNLFIGTITNPTLFSECNVIRDYDNLTVTAINLNCISPGKVIVVKDIDNNKYYCFTEIENSIASTKNILYRKTIPILDNKGNYFNELLDLGNKLNNKYIYIGGTKFLLNKNTSVKKIKNLKNNNLVKLKVDDIKFKIDNQLEDMADYLISYSDSCLSYSVDGITKNNKKYFSFIEKDTDNYVLNNNINLQSTKNINNNTKYYVTTFTPFILHSFISNGDIPSKVNTNLSSFFTQPIPLLKRDKKKYNPNFYYIWKLQESDAATYGFGWVNLEGQLQVSRYAYNISNAIFRSNYIFHTDNLYNGYLKLMIGGMDRTSLIANRTFSPRLLFDSVEEERNGIGSTPFFEADNVKKINNDIQKSNN